MNKQNLSSNIPCKIIYGTFISEEKNRFLCNVRVDGAILQCYVPSSCRLEHLIALPGKKVLLLPNGSKNSKTKYSLFAVAYKRSYIILNSNIANILIGNNLHSRRFSYLGKRTKILREYTLDSYKSDFFICDTSTIVEVKSIITEADTAVYPSVYSARLIEQLKYIELHLKQGKPACYIIVSLNPYLRSVTFDTDNPAYALFKSCQKLGMSITGVCCRMHQGSLIISGTVNIAL